MNDFSNSETKILVTGAGGFIGSRVYSYLQGVGYDVHGLSRKTRDDFIVADFGDGNQMKAILNDIEPHVILHCAGVTPHATATDDDYVRVNLESSKVLLNAARNQNIHFINASTLGVYGQPISDDGDVHEGDACAPLSPYAQSKYDFENHLKSQDETRFVNLRIANIPGRDAFINYVIDNGRVQLNGDTPYVRDYIHLNDLCTLFGRSIDYLMSGDESITVNAGAGVGFTFPDIVDEIENQTGLTIGREYAKPKTGDVVKIICDISTAQQKLNWSPSHLNLKDIIDYALHNKNI